MPLANDPKRGIAAFRPQRPVASPPGTPARPQPALKARQHLLDVPFPMRAVAQAAGASWNAVAKSFCYRGPSLPEALVPFAALPYSWERFREDELNGVETVERKPTRTITLRSHQDEATAAIRNAYEADHPGFLLADDVGLGKTIEAADAILAMDEVETVLVVCPLAVVAHWRRTFQWMGDRGKRIVIINYDRLQKLFEVPADIPVKTRTKRKKTRRRVRTQKGVARYGSALDFDLVVFDESHRLRNRDTARSKLAEKLGDEADFILWLSATAGQNPLELSYLAPILARSAGTKLPAKDAWEEWCKNAGMGIEKGAFGKWTWRGHSDDPVQKDASASDLDVMRRLLFEGDVPVGIRRTPEDIVGWPSIQRILFPVDLDAMDRQLYAQAWTEFRDAVGLERNGARDSKNGLVAQLRFRQKASLLRTGPTVELAEELLAQGRQVIVSVAFRETLEIIAEALEKSGYVVSRIHGQLNASDKEHQRLDFQYGRSTVVVHTIEEGISLHEGEYDDGSQAPRANLIHDLRWSSIAMKQIEGRGHRDSKSCPAYWLVGAGTIEEQVAEIVSGRLVSMSRMQGDQGTVEAVEALIQDALRSRRPALELV